MHPSQIHYILLCLQRAVNRLKEGEEELCWYYPFLWVEAEGKL